MYLHTINENNKSIVVFNGEKIWEYDYHNHTLNLLEKLQERLTIFLEVENLDRLADLEEDMEKELLMREECLSLIESVEYKENNYYVSSLFEELTMKLSEGDVITHLTLINETAFDCGLEMFNDAFRNIIRLSKVVSSC